MQQYLLRNFSQLAQKRAIIMREEAQLWDILSRDLEREAGRLEGASGRGQANTTVTRPGSGEPIRDSGEKLFVRVSEAARIMGIGRSSLYNEINASRIKIRKCGRKTLIAVADIQGWFDGLPHGDNV